VSQKRYFGNRLWASTVGGARHVKGASVVLGVVCGSVIRGWWIGEVHSYTISKKT